MIDKNSPLGKLYQKKKRTSPSYQGADFHGVDEIVKLIDQAGLEPTEIWQTLTDITAEKLPPPNKVMEKEDLLS